MTVFTMLITRNCKHVVGANAVDIFYNNVIVPKSTYIELLPRTISTSQIKYEDITDFN